LKKIFFVLKLKFFYIVGTLNVVGTDCMDYLKIKKNLFLFNLQ